MCNEDVISTTTTTEAEMGMIINGLTMCDDGHSSRCFAIQATTSMTKGGKGDAERKIILNAGYYFQTTNFSGPDARTDSAKVINAS